MFYQATVAVYCVLPTLIEIEVNLCFVLIQILVLVAISFAGRVLGVLTALRRTKRLVLMGAQHALWIPADIWYGS